MDFDTILRKSILEDLTIDGGWQEFGYDNNKENMEYGTLEYKNNLGKLSIFQSGRTKSNKGYLIPEITRKSNIMGTMANRNDVYVYIPKIAAPLLDSPIDALLDVLTKDWFFNFFSVTNYSPNIDANLNDISDEFHELIINLTFLNEWILSFDIDLRKHSDKEKKIVNFRHNGQDYSLYLINKKMVYILIKASSPIFTEEAINLAKEFQKLLGIVTGKSVSTKQLSKIDSDNNRHQDIYYLERILKQEQGNLSPNDSFAYNEINFGYLVKKWFESTQNMKLLVQDYLLTLNYVETVENKLINLTQGIEAYYRNEKKASLYEKIMMMLNTFPQQIKQAIKKYDDLEDFANSLKDTRVFITHGSNTKHKIDNFQKLSNYVNALQYLEQYFILSELGMKDINILKVTSRLNVLFSTEFI